MNLKNSLIISLLSVAPLTCMAATEANFSYASGNLSLEQWGTEKTYENYDIAIRLDDPMLVGKKITGMSVGVPSSAYISDLSGWLSSELKISGKNNVPDIVSVEGSVSNGALNITFPEAYTIPQTGVYVGYSLKIGGTAVAASAQPISVVSGAKEGSFFVHTTRAYLSWKDLSTELGLTSTINVALEGDFLEDALAVMALPNIMADPDKEVVIPTQLRNDGANQISSIEYEVEINGKKSQFSYTFKNTNRMTRFLQTETIELPIGLINSVGRTIYSLTVTSVNGKPNNSASPVATGDVDVVAYRPVNRPLLEEYTAFTCGYCPRGMAAFERMYELYPDDFIGVAYHSDDEIAFTASFPNPCPALPTAYMNRTTKCDPYFGLTTGTFGIEEFWNQERQKEVPMGIELTVLWNDEERTKLNANAQVVFVAPADQQYSLTYLLVTGGLKNDDWYQSNYYSGNTASGWISEMNQFFKADHIMRGVVYDDIAAMSAPYSGIEGSLPASPEPYAICRHSYEFDLSQCVSRKGVNMAPDKDKIRVVGIVVDAEGKAVNSFMAKPSGFGNGVDTIAENEEVVETRYFDLSGRHLSSAPEKGICIVREILANGNSRSYKVAR